MNSRAEQQIDSTLDPLQGSALRYRGENKVDSKDFVSETKKGLISVPLRQKNSHKENMTPTLPVE